MSKFKIADFVHAQSKNYESRYDTGMITDIKNSDAGECCAVKGNWYNVDELTLIDLRTRTGEEYVHTISDYIRRLKENLDLVELSLENDLLRARAVLAYEKDTIQYMLDRVNVILREKGIRGITSTKGEKNV